MDTSTFFTDLIGLFFSGFLSFGLDFILQFLAAFLV